MEENYGEAVAMEMLSLTPLLYNVMFQTRKSTLLGSIPPTQLQALVALMLRSPLNMSQLAEWLKISKQQLTRVVDALVEKDLVQRKENCKNRRIVLIEMTGVGKQFLENLMKEKAKSIAEELNQLPQEERDILMSAAQIIKKRLNGGTCCERSEAI